MRSALLAAAIIRIDGKPIDAERRGGRYCPGERNIAQGRVRGAVAIAIDFQSEGFTGASIPKADAKAAAMMNGAAAALPMAL